MNSGSYVKLQDPRAEHIDIRSDKENTEILLFFLQIRQIFCDIDNEEIDEKEH